MNYVIGMVFAGVLIYTLGHLLAKHRRVLARFRSLMQHASDVVVVVDLDGAIRYQTPSAERILGYGPDELVGRKLFDQIHPEDLAHVRLFWETIAGQPGVTIAHEWRVRRSDGEWLPVETVGNNLVHHRHMRGIMLNMRDISERKALEAELAHQALHDPLTRLPNRALFMDRLRHALVRAQQRHTTIAILFLDLDRFKVINDSLGHHLGDFLLVAVAQRLLASVRPGDTVARLGGDEFTILLEDDADIQAAVAVAERIQQQLQAPVTLNEHQMFVSTSIGIVLSTAETAEPEKLLRSADVAMYRAKDNGKAHYVVFDRALDGRAWDRLDLETDVRLAVDHRQFHLVYQPIVCLKTGRISGFEALLRWNHPQRGAISPVEFIPLVEELGLILPLGRWVLAEACRQAQVWRLQYPDHPPLRMCVNIAAQQLQHPTLIDDITGALCEAGLEPECLQLEMTESNMMQGGEATVATLHELKRLGMRLSTDDFGTGYSSLAYLRLFPIDTLKIDRSFVSRLGSASEDAAIVRAIGMLAHTLNLQVVGEGIETAEQLVVLHELGCQYGQGFYFSRPVPPESAGALLARPPVWADQQSILLPRQSGVLVSDPA